MESYYRCYTPRGSLLLDKATCDGDLIIGYIDELVRRNMSKLREIDGSCKLIVRGSTRGEWVFRPNEAGINCKEEDIKTDCTIVVSQETLAGIRTGRVNPVEAFYEGKVAINGDLELAKRVGRRLLG